MTSGDKFIFIGLCILVALIATFVVYRATAETPDDCGYTGDGFGDINQCQQNIYHRLGVLVEEQNQTNHLLAKSLCVQEEWNEPHCIQQELNDSK